MSGNLPLSDERASIRVHVFERTLESDDIARLRRIDFLDERSERRRLAATGWTRDYDETTRRLGQSPQARVQIAGPEVLDRGCQQAHREGDAADGCEQIDATARASHLHRNVRRAPAQEAGPAVGAQKVLARSLKIHRAGSFAQRLKLA